MERIERPSWRVTVATDDNRIIELSASAQLGQLYLSAGDTSRPSEHVCTLNAKTYALDNLIDALIEAKDHLELETSPLAMAPADPTTAGAEAAATPDSTRPT